MTLACRLPTRCRPNLPSCVWCISCFRTALFAVVLVRSILAYSGNELAWSVHEMVRIKVLLRYGLLSLASWECGSCDWDRVWVPNPERFARPGPDLAGYCRSSPVRINPTTPLVRDAGAWWGLLLCLNHGSLRSSHAAKLT